MLLNLMGAQRRQLNTSLSATFDRNPCVERGAQQRL